MDVLFSHLSAEMSVVVPSMIYSRVLMRRPIMKKRSMMMLQLFQKVKQRFLNLTFNMVKQAFATVARSPNFQPNTVINIMLCFLLFFFRYTQSKQFYSFTFFGGFFNKKPIFSFGMFEKLCKDLATVIFAYLDQNFVRFGAGGRAGQPYFMPVLLLLHRNKGFPRKLNSKTYR